MFIQGLEQLRKEMFQECGGKAAHLGELTSLHLNVPGGFSVLGRAYYHHLQANDLRGRVDAVAGTLACDDFQDLENKTRQIRELIMAAPVPVVIRQQIVEHYGRLSETGEAFVAVRSSVAIKDSAVSSFPGMMDTYHYVKGAENVVAKVRECWASVWSARAAFARYSKKLDHQKAVIAPTIQLMVNSEIAGVLFTVNPVSRSKDEIVIESNWGLGETVVCGRYHSDFYVISKGPCFGQYSATCSAGSMAGHGDGAPAACVAIKQKRIARKTESYVQAEGGGAQAAPVPPDKVSQPTLTEAQIQELCRTVCLIEEHYGCHQDIEWAYEKGKLYILQARTAKVGEA